MWTRNGRKQQVETEHEAGRDLGCKTADWGAQTDWKRRSRGRETEGKRHGE